MSNIDKVSLTKEVFFEVRNAVVYGGEGSVGYESFLIKQTGYHNKTSEEFFSDAYLEKMRKSWAAICNVSEENVRMISEEEYHFFTDDEDDD